MAYAKPQFGQYRTAAEAPINSRRPSYFDDEDGSAVLDPGILDNDIMQSPADAQPRKGSFANNHGVLTPVESQGWDPRYGNALAVDTSAGPSHLYHDDINGFPGRAAPHGANFAPPPPHPDAWSYGHGSGHCTPTAGVELEFAQPPPPPGYEHAHYGHHRNDSARASFSHMTPSAPPPNHHFHGSHPEAPFPQAPQVQTPLSPHSQQDWMAMAAQEVEQKRRRPNTPSRTSVDMQRRDGIRKKNGRIEIPHERTIQTIDEMIESATDEDLLKELKQQKRLLRNREAALASRQRKKKHTEDLEHREKAFSGTVSHLETQVSQLQYELQRQERSNQILLHKLQEATQQHETAQEEKRDLVLRHNDETTSLRKKIQVLSEQLENYSAPMSHQPSSTGFNDFNSSMEALSMGTGSHDWDSFNFLDLDNDLSSDFTFDMKPEPAISSPAIEKRNTPSTTVTPASEKKSTDGSSEQPMASGLLFFLLLCGAFVASKPASSRPADLPQVPEDIRQAAPAVLSNLLSSESTPSQRHGATGQSAMEPAPSNLPQAKRLTGRLDQIHQRITSPSKEQEANEAFALTTQEYASISGMNFLSEHDRPGPSSRHDAPPPRKRNLAEMLANMQNDQSRNKAEVYTRSLLWDQIPGDVVRQFKEMVRDQNEIEARQNSQTTHDDMYSFKTES